MSPDFKHQYFPSTINPPDGKETRGKEEFIEVLRFNLLTVFDKVTYLTPLDVIHGSDAVVFHLKSDGISKSGKKYNNEYMVTFHFVGDKIIKLNEFVDSKYSSAYFASLREDDDEDDEAEERQPSPGGLNSPAPGSNEHVQVTPPPPPPPPAPELVDEPESTVAKGAEEEEELRIPGSFDLSDPAPAEGESSWAYMLRKMTIRQ
ncbi:hypothetical protein B0H19DRAFT_1264465 [Mycena capillaripes]|nr:hypothetical protein B0H19DRAFT_1264465 [Mycena capillaripes]